MQSKDLRIGNWVEIIKSKGHQTTIQASCFSVNIEKNYKSIALTEKWLLNFGFEQAGNFYSLGRFHLYKDNNDIVYLNYGWMVIDLLYVHKLQNLYFALTGEDLKLNTK